MPERRLRADWSLPGHWPAHDARCRGDAKRAMSTPISARMHSAPRCWIRRSCTAFNGRRERADLLLDGVREPVDLLVQEVDVREDRPDPERVMRVEVPGERFTQLRDLLAHLPARELGEHVRVSRARDERASSVSRPDLPITPAATQSRLIPASSRALWSRLTSRERSWICVLR